MLLPLVDKLYRTYPDWGLLVFLFLSNTLLYMEINHLNIFMLDAQ